MTLYVSCTPAYCIMMSMENMGDARERQERTPQHVKKLFFQRIELRLCDDSKRGENRPSHELRQTLREDQREGFEE